MRSWILGSAVVACLLLLTAELTLRLRGWLEIPVYLADPRHEYMYAPHQSVHAGPIHVRTNSLGMRSAEPRKAKKRVLFIGDSVINGTDRVTHGALATTVAEPLLSAAMHMDVQVLNASAASWGPDNAMAFLRANEALAPDAVVAVFSSHDAYDNMDFSPVVGVHPGYPDEGPTFALQRLPLRLRTMRMPPAPGRSEVSFNQGWQDLVQYCAGKGIPLLVVHHAELSELQKGAWNSEGTLLEDSLRAMRVAAVDGRTLLRSAHYADFIHLNAEGHAALAHALVPLIAGTFAR